MQSFKSFRAKLTLTKSLSQKHISTFNVERHSEIYKLQSQFMKQYDPFVGIKEQPIFGFNGVGEIAYMRSYSRVKEKTGT